MAKWKPATSSSPQGLGLTPVLFVGDMDSGIDCTLSKFANDTKLFDAVNTVDGRDAIQKDPDWIESQACSNLMKFNQDKCRVLHVGQGNSKHKYSLGGKLIESSPEEKDLGGVGW
ncbi:rna-directed dna polymerase from mobile element jockey-like [Limosa lapponica baueri]|uniref:Rna-directed dna polymerase from mobile element jockey-like n=1 Tax=Limosa lapponica baueri TaxID=1758121 RepID=A0A2I0TY94_LIMLA|nr:rna-directed dna polymerase from mobile element jockey-like [Limosa lapponica baueri]